MRKSLLIIVFISSLLFPRKVIVKLATLAPEGTDWHGMLIQMGQEWKKESKGAVQLKIYPSGVIGDERDMVRKMRIGQIHAAGITTEGLTEIVPDFSAFFVPLAFQSLEDVQNVTDALLPDLEKQIESKGFKLLYLSDLGWVYWFSTTELRTPNHLKNKKIFTWAGDFKWEQTWKKAGYSPVSLASTDILSGLQTGLIDAMPTMPIYALAQQSFGIVNHMLDLKWGVLMAGIIIDLKTWNRIPEKYHKNLIAITQKIQTDYKSSNQEAENNAITAMKQYGLKVHSITEEEKKMWQEQVNKMESYLRGDIIPETVYDKVIDLTK